MPDTKLNLYFEDSRSSIEIASNTEIDGIIFTVRELDIDEEATAAQSSEFPILKTVNTAEIYIDHEEGAEIAEALKFLDTKNRRSR